MKFNKLFDHTLLRQDATSEEIRKLCQEAKEYDFASVCVNPDFVSLARKELAGSDVKVCTVIGFPLGANIPEVKAFEAKKAIEDGAEEIDMVQNVSKVKEGDYAFIKEEVAAVKKACGPVLLKVILETCLLNEEEIRLSSLASKDGGADYVKTSTGFSKAGADPRSVKIMADAVGPSLGVKASGGIHSKADVDAMVAAGATRIGASASVRIMQELK